MKHKLRDWTKRYFPAEIVGTITALLISTFTFILTGNYIVTAFAGAWGESLGYYGFISTRDILSSRRHHRSKNKKYGIRSFSRNIRNLFLEFGVSEIFDGIFVRPFFMYIFPLMLGNLQLGIFIGKIVSDVFFYIPTITAYELRKKHLKD